MVTTVTDRLFGENSSVAIKAPVLAVTNGTQLPLVGLTPVGSYTPKQNDRILVKDQPDTTTNGIYNASVSAWTRSGDFDGAYDCVQGTLVVVNLGGGTSQLFQLTTPNPVIGTTPLVFQPYSLPAGPWIDAQLTYGLVPDGVTDNTAAFQAMCAASGQSIFLRRGAYVTGTFTVPANSMWYMEPGTTIKDSGHLGASTSLLNLSSNCSIVGFGATIDGNKSAYTGSFSASRMGVMIFGNGANISNVRVVGLTSQNNDGDGFYIGGGGANGIAKNVVLDQCTGTANRRQGLSITSANGADIINCSFTSQSGADPQAGIDIEANDSNAELLGIRIINPYTSGNTGSGIDIAVSNLGLTTSKRVGITISGHTSVGDANTTGHGGIRITGNTAAGWPNSLYGQVVYRDAQIFTPGIVGVLITDWDGTKAPWAIVENVSVYDAAGAANPANTYDCNGVTVFAGPGVTMPSVGNFVIRNVKIYDDRGSPLTYTGCYIYNNSVPVANYTIEDIECLGFTPLVGANRDIVILSSGSSNGIVKYSREKIVTITSSDSAVNYLGKTIVFGASCVLTLPAAAQVLGQHFKFVNGGNFTGQVRPTNPDVIGSFWGGSGTGDTILNYAGDELVVRATSSGHFSIEAISDGAKRPLGQTSPLPQIWGTASPQGVSTATWPAGAMCWNATPSVGNPKGWVCTVAGTPGTWVSMGNL